jgi:hypothetical protein
MELNNWLKKHVFDNQHYRSIEPPAHTCDNYDKIFGYLARSNNAIKSQQRALLADQMLFEYFLHLLCGKHFNEYVCGGKISTLQTLLIYRPYRHQHILHKSTLMDWQMQILVSKT